MAAFFQATHEAWKDNVTSGEEQFYVGYSPIIVVDAAKILDDLPRAHVLHVVRNPWSAYADTKKRPVPLGLPDYLLRWTLNQHFALLYRARYPESKVHIVRAEDVIASPSGRSPACSRNLASGADHALGKPTWNGRALEQVYPWGTIGSATPEANLATANELSDEEKQEVSQRAWQYTSKGSGTRTSSRAEPMRCLITGAYRLRRGEPQPETAGREPPAHSPARWAAGIRPVATHGRGARRDDAGARPARLRRSTRVDGRHSSGVGLSPSGPRGIFLADGSGHRARGQRGRHGVSRRGGERGGRGCIRPCRVMRSEYGFRSRPAATGGTVPNSAYAVGKLAATSYCACVGQLDSRQMVSGFRLYSVYGPYEEPGRLVPTLVARGLRGEPAPSGPSHGA